MFSFNQAPNTSKKEFYTHFLAQFEYIIEKESDFIANLANVSSLISHTFKDVNWVGFYLLKDNRLVLGPFQGKPAVGRIDLGKGVCGKAAERKKSIVVQDICKFIGHITCDEASKSEIAIPLIKNNTLLGVLDIDSYSLSRFNSEDQYYLEHLVEILLNTTLSTPKVAIAT